MQPTGVPVARRFGCISTNGRTLSASAPVGSAASVLRRRAVHTLRVVCFQQETEQGEGAAAASRRRLQQHLTGSRVERDDHQLWTQQHQEQHDGPDGEEDASAIPIHDIASGTAAAAYMAGQEHRRAEAAAGAAADAADDDARLRVAQGWADDMPPSVTASLSIMPRRRAAALTRHRMDDPITSFFVKCKLAWQLFFPSTPEERAPLSSSDVGRQRLSMILVADRAGLSPGSLMQMKQNTVRALAETMDMQELADAQLKFTMVREEGVTYSMAVPIINDVAIESGADHQDADGDADEDADEDADDPSMDIAIDSADEAEGDAAAPTERQGDDVIAEAARQLEQEARHLISSGESSVDEEWDGSTKWGLPETGRPGDIMRDLTEAEAEEGPPLSSADSTVAQQSGAGTPAGAS